MLGVRLSTFDFQRSTFDVRLSTFNVRHSTFNAVYLHRPRAGRGQVMRAPKGVVSIFRYSLRLGVYEDVRLPHRTRPPGARDRSCPREVRVSNPGKMYPLTSFNTTHLLFGFPQMQGLVGSYLLDGLRPSRGVKTYDSHPGTVC